MTDKSGEAFGAVYPVSGRRRNVTGGAEPTVYIDVSRLSVLVGVVGARFRVMMILCSLLNFLLGWVIPSTP